MNNSLVSKLALLGLSLCFCTASVAAIYKYVDENGKVHYGDKPVEGAERMKIRNQQRSGGKQASDQQTLPEPDIGEARGKTEDKDAVSYENLEILTPKNESQTPGLAGDVAVVLLSTPRLAAGHKIVIALDGKEISNGRHASVNLSNVARGKHTLSAQIVDQSGTSLIQAPGVSFFVKRPIINKNSPLAFERE